VSRILSGHRGMKSLYFVPSRLPILKYNSVDDRNLGGTWPITKYLFLEHHCVVGTNNKWAYRHVARTKKERAILAQLRSGHVTSSDEPIIDNRAGPVTERKVRVWCHAEVCLWELENQAKGSQKGKSGALQQKGKVRVTAALDHEKHPNYLLAASYIPWTLSLRKPLLSL
jgi:hypothetical protein